MRNIDPVELQSAVRSAERFLELVHLDAPNIFVHTECTTLITRLARLAHRCIVPYEPEPAPAATGTDKCTCDEPEWTIPCGVHGHQPD